MKHEYNQLFPEFNTRLVKFAPGVLNWHLSGEISLDNPIDVKLVHSMLKIIDNSPAFDYFDSMFNESDPQTVCDIIGMSSETKNGTKPFHTCYKVRVVKSYDDLQWLRNAVEWCIVICEESYDSFMNSGSRFIICENEGWKKVECIPGENFPLDNYGLSLLAVEINKDNCIQSITSRWNDNGDKITKSHLQTLLGNKFNILFNIYSLNSK